MQDLATKQALARRLGRSNASDGTAEPAESQRTYIVARYAELSALPDRYEPLFLRAGNASVFSTLAWYRNFVRSLAAPNESLRIYAVEAAEDPGTARGLLVMRHCEARTGLLGVRTLDGLSNYYTSLFGPIIGPDEADAQAIIQTLVTAIARDEMRWHVIDLHPLEIGTSVFPALKTAFENAGLMTRKYFCFGNWYLPVGGRSFAEYFDTLSAQLRNTITRKRKQLDKTGRGRMVIYRETAGLDDALRAYEGIYSASWKIPEPYPDFIRGLCRGCAEAGSLRLGMIYVDGAPAAAQIWLVHAGIATIYKLAYDERYAKHSPGSILTAYMMEHVIDVDKVHEVDYLTGDDEYKKGWMSHRRERWGIVAFNLRTPYGLLAASRHVAGRVARRAINAARSFRAVDFNLARRASRRGYPADPR